ncbi:(deoxy)nucleoside triphosphate pyrophosphohydrolase [Planctomicrobium sp. SH527]|uniref:(deoxy)nucleoside triphosphate pyrophosphohydrolase n=1 Tax=Planctomicrobium sp. SH527 TaxID=3448123 RepID=UPI003F5B2601
MTTSSEHHSESRATDVKRIGVAVVKRGEYLLIGVRGAGQVLAGLHEFPGGKCEPGESGEECAIRECQEETGQVIEIIDPLYQTRHSYPHGIVEIEFFLCRVIEPGKTPLLGNFTWVPIRDLPQLTFPEANIPVLKQLYEQHMLAS